MPVIPTTNDRRLMGMPSISDGFPIKFECGARWNSISAKCSECDGVIPMDRIHGQVIWPLPTVADVEGLAWCEHCQLWSRIRIRLREDMSMDGPVPGDEKRWGRWGEDMSMDGPVPGDEKRWGRWGSKKGWAGFKRQFTDLLRSFTQ